MKKNTKKPHDTNQKKPEKASGTEHKQQKPSASSLVNFVQDKKKGGS